jgi:hypothetical protein
VALGDRGASLDVVESLHDLHPVHHRESFGESRALEPLGVDVHYPFADDWVAELVGPVRGDRPAPVELLGVVQVALEDRVDLLCRAPRQDLLDLLPSLLRAVLGRF